MKKLLLELIILKVKKPTILLYLRIDDSIRQLQVDKITKLKNNRDSIKAIQCLESIATAAKNGSNLMPFVIEAVENKCTLGEIADVLRKEFGEYK